MSERWVPFHWESSVCWGAVKSRDEWLAMVAKYARMEAIPVAEAHGRMLRFGRVAPYGRPFPTLESGGRLSIGTRPEHRGQPLTEWAAERGMDLSLPEATP